LTRSPSFTLQLINHHNVTRDISSQIFISGWFCELTAYASLHSGFHLSCAEVSKNKYYLSPANYPKCVHGFAASFQTQNKSATSVVRFTLHWMLVVYSFNTIFIRDKKNNLENLDPNGRKIQIFFWKWLSTLFSSWL
jgi:hypothetical protein